MFMDVKYLYLSTDSMILYEYIQIELNTITDKVCLNYNLYEYMYNGYVYAEFRKLI